MTKKNINSKIELLKELLVKDVSLFIDARDETKKHRAWLLNKFGPEVLNAMLNFDVEALAQLKGKITEDELAEIEASFDAVMQQIDKTHSFKEATTWTEAFIKHNLSSTENRLNELAEALEKEFPEPDILEKNRPKMATRLEVQLLMKIALSNSIILYALDMNGPAIIELHSTLERQAINELAKSIFLPEKTEIGLTMLERYRLPELASMLREYGILNNEDVKFAKNLSKLRDGFAHKNLKKISNAVFSGKSMEGEEVDFIMSEVDCIPFIVGAIHFSLKMPTNQID